MELVIGAGEWAAGVLRIIIGPLFAIHGYPKFIDLKGTKKFVKSVGFPLPGFFAFMTASTEFVGGLAILAGFATRLACILLMINMMVAFYFNSVVWKKNFISGYELDLVLLAGLVALFLLGAGVASADSMFGWFLG